MLNQLNLNIDQLKRLNNINRKNKKKFVKLLEQVFKQTNCDYKWVLTPIFARDNYQSELLKDLNFLSLVDFYVKRKNCKKIVVDNDILKKIIQKKYKNIIILKVNIFRKLLFNILNLFNSFLKITLYSVIMLLLKNNKRANQLRGKNVILIETFFSKNLYKKKFNDRYHKEIYSKFPKKIKEKCFFFPINLSIFYINKYLNCIKNEKIRFIHPLDFLKVKDYIKSIFLIPNLGAIKSGKIMYENFEISRIIKYHHKFSYFNFSSFIGNINYIFFKRLKQKQIKIKLILDWYENQIIDKGVCLGKNVFYPESTIKGHMGYINDYNSIHYYNPTTLEKRLKSLPDEILLISKGVYKKIYSKINYLKFKFVPAVRNRKIFDIKQKNKKNIKTKVLIIFSANDKESYFFLKLIKKIIKLFNLTRFEFIIKPHPATRINFDNELKKYVKISKQNFYKLLSTSDIVISGGTTATIEASILNKEIIIIGNNQDLLLNPLFHRTKKTNICYDEKTLIKFINELAYNNKKNRNKLNKKILNSYFIKFSNKYFENFYKIS